MCDERHEALLDNQFKILMDDAGVCLRGRFAEDEFGVTQGKQIVSVGGEAFVEHVLHAGAKFEANVGAVEVGLQHQRRVTHLLRSEVVVALDAVRRASHGGVAELGQRTGHGQGIVDGYCAIVQGRKQMTMEIYHNDVANSV